MVVRIFNGWRLAAVLGMTTLALAAAEFAAPAEGPVAFRRDRLSIDADTMADLSRHLATVAEGVGMKTPNSRRTVAQALALAIALDPGNSDVRNLISRLEKHPDRELDGDAPKIEKAQAHVWKTLEWLESPAAGPDANALANCVTDVLVVSDPENPRSVALHDKPQLGAWSRWIPPLSAYTGKKSVPTPGAPPTTPTEVAKHGILLESAEVSTLLWENSAKPDSVPNWKLALATLKMTAKMAEDEKEAKLPFSLRIGKSEESSTARAMIAPLLAALTKLHGNLPDGGQVTISSPALEKSLSSGKRQAFSGVVAVLASSAISGKTPSAIILGQIDQNGAYTLPSGFWRQIQALPPGTGQRLVLPAAAADYLPSMLALEKPEFFWGYEIVLAADFKALVALSEKSPPEEFAPAFAQFQEIRSKGAGQEFRSYIGNPFVRRRLADLAQEMPIHASARMLAIQGAGNRPIFVARPVLCGELLRALEPIAALTGNQDGTHEELKPDKLSSLYETTKARVDHLVRYSEKSDRDLIARAQEAVVAVRAVERAAKTRGESYEIRSAVESAVNALSRTYTAVTQELANGAADRDAVPSH
jgi:hypothetical protein